MSEVAKIRAAWIEKGEPHCDHPRIDKEYGFGMDTGDWACLDCGDTGARESKPRTTPPDGEGAQP
ncbi:MAG: hypothetical protein ACXW0R_08830 [Gaiellaceae bacterium]